MRVLVIGSGGREHALCHRIARSPKLTELFCAPGNAGIAEIAECVALKTEDAAAVIKFCRDKNISLVVIGPEAPLVAGLADDLRAAGIACFGPGKVAAQLEGSKSFSKDFCAKYKIPTAESGTFTDAESARKYIRQKGAPIVVKADGLAAGKGVTVAHSIAEAEAAVDESFGGKFGDAGKILVVEECLVGEEISFFALIDGKSACFLGAVQDHKAAFDGDTGPNTGGMGTYAPAPLATAEFNRKVMEEIVKPVVAGIANEKMAYRGVLFVGIMVTSKGPQVLEFNVRFGDPETQVLMSLLDGDVLELLDDTANARLTGRQPAFVAGAAICVVMAAEGYPGDYVKNTEIKNLAAAGAVAGVKVFHAGTARQGDKLLANGGRVLGVTAIAADIKSAQQAAYSAVDLIDWPQGFCRRDIGWRAIDRK